MQAGQRASLLGADYDDSEDDGADASPAMDQSAAVTACETVTLADGRTAMLPFGWTAGATEAGVLYFGHAGRGITQWEPPEGTAFSGAAASAAADDTSSPPAAATATAAEVPRQEAAAAAATAAIPATSDAATEVIVESSADEAARSLAYRLPVQRVTAGGSRSCSGSVSASLSKLARSVAESCAGLGTLISRSVIMLEEVDGGDNRDDEGEAPPHKRAKIEDEDGDGAATDGEWHAPDTQRPLQRVQSIVVTFASPTSAAEAYSRATGRSAAASVQVRRWVDGTVLVGSAAAGTEQRLAVLLRHVTAGEVASARADDVAVPPVEHLDPLDRSEGTEAKRRAAAKQVQVRVAAAAAAVTVAAAPALAPPLVAEQAEAVVQYRALLASGYTAEEASWLAFGFSATAAATAAAAATEASGAGLSAATAGGYGSAGAATAAAAAAAVPAALAPMSGSGNARGLMQKWSRVAAAEEAEAEAEELTRLRRQAQRDWQRRQASGGAAGTDNANFVPVVPKR